jgi:hypothetical protein
MEIYTRGTVNTKNEIVSEKGKKNGTGNLESAMEHPNADCDTVDVLVSSGRESGRERRAVRASALANFLASRPGIAAMKKAKLEDALFLRFFFPLKRVE